MTTIAIDHLQGWVRRSLATTPSRWSQLATLPQAALRLDARPQLWDDEVRIEVETLLMDKLDVSVFGREAIFLVVTSTYGQAPDERLEQDLDPFGDLEVGDVQRGAEPHARDVHLKLLRDVLGETAHGDVVDDLLEDAAVVADARGHAHELDGNLHLELHARLDLVEVDVHQIRAQGLDLDLAHEGAEALFGRADQAMYRAKAAGRDRVVAEDTGASDAWAGLASTSPIQLVWQDRSEEHTSELQSH